MKGLFNGTLDHKLNSIEIEFHLLWELEEKSTFRWDVTNMMSTLLDNLDLVATVARIVKTGSQDLRVL